MTACLYPSCVFHSANFILRHQYSNKAVQNNVKMTFNAVGARKRKGCDEREETGGLAGGGERKTCKSAMTH